MSIRHKAFFINKWMLTSLNNTGLIVPQALFNGRKVNKNNLRLRAVSI